MNKKILLIGVILLIIGIFVWLSTSNILSQVQSAKGSYLPSDYDKVAVYEQALQNIWNTAYLVEMVGFIIFVIGLILSIVGIIGIPPIFKKENRNKPT